MDPAQILEMEVIARNSVINETIARGDSLVQQFYADAVVLITGASGFLGKQLIEKLFRCNVQKVYILLRSKRGKDVEDRLKNILKDQLYEHLHKTDPDFVNKLVPIEADVSKILLGMSESNWNTLIDEVNIIFHGAATVNFTESLKAATLTNIRGTRELLTFAKSCKHLKSLVHISTAFAHVNSDYNGQSMLEQFYKCPLSPNFLMDLVQELNEDTLDAITPQLIAKWPNTYTFTKALAEELIRTTTADLPVCIVRPSIGVTVVADILIKELNNVSKETSYVRRKKERKKRSIWTREWILRREKQGASDNFLREVRLEDKTTYKNHLRLNGQQFDYLLEKVTSKRADTVMRPAVPAKIKLQITMRYLATGDSFPSLESSFRVSKSSISKFLPEVLDAIYEGLEDYIKHAREEMQLAHSMFFYHSQSSMEEIAFCGQLFAFLYPVLWAYRETPGWIDTYAMNGPVGFITGIIIGGLHVLYTKPDTVLDMVPVDLVNNAIMAAAYDTVKRHSRGETDIRIYTVTSTRNPLRIMTMKKLVLDKGRALTTPKILWHTYIIVTASKFLFFLLIWLLHFVPGYLIDFILKLKGQKPKAIKFYTKAYKLNILTGSFLTTTTNNFEDSNLLELNGSLSPDDRIIFECDTATVENTRFMHIGVVGIRKYIFKDGLKNTEVGVRKAFWLRLLNLAFLVIYMCILWKFVSVIILVLLTRI